MLSPSSLNASPATAIIRALKRAQNSCSVISPIALLLIAGRRACNGRSRPASCRGRPGAAVRLGAGSLEILADREAERGEAMTEIVAYAILADDLRLGE